MQIEL